MHKNPRAYKPGDTLLCKFFKFFCMVIFFEFVLAESYKRFFYKNHFHNKYGKYKSRKLCSQQKNRNYQLCGYKMFCNGKNQAEYEEHCVDIRIIDNFITEIFCVQTMFFLWHQCDFLPKSIVFHDFLTSCFTSVNTKKLV